MVCLGIWPYGRLRGNGEGTNEVVDYLFFRTLDYDSLHSRTNSARTSAMSTRERVDPYMCIARRFIETVTEIVEGSVLGRMSSLYNLDIVVTSPKMSSDYPTFDYGCLLTCPLHQSHCLGSVLSQYPSANSADRQLPGCPNFSTGLHSLSAMSWHANAATYSCEVL